MVNRWLLTIAVCLACQYMDNDGLARDPFNPTGFPACAGGEVGYWQFVTRETPEKKISVSLVLTIVDVADPAFVICWVDGRHRVQAIGPEKQL